ncbi:MAG TPA: hypothetical protein EYH08_07900, partial [Pyrodictium sp.]|nr:hypothetical protein [Pyrodictium sp.]
MVKGVFTVVGAILFLAILGAMIVLIMSTFTNYMNTMQTVQQQQQQLSKLQQQLQQGLVGWINTSTTSTGIAWINATIYNVGLVTVNLTSILVVWPNNTATPIEKLAYTVSFTPPACGSNTTIDNKLTIKLQPACRVDLNIRADVDSETAKYINLTRIVAIGYTFTAGPLAPTPAQTTLQLQHYKLTKTPTPTTTTTPTPILQLAKRHAIAWDTFDTDPFAEGKLYVLVRTRDTSYGWSNGKVWLNTTDSTDTRDAAVLSIAINISKYNPAYPEINETIANKVYIIANFTMLNAIMARGISGVYTGEYLVFPNTTLRNSNYYALGGWNYTSMWETYEELTIIVIFPSQGGGYIIGSKQLPATLLTYKTATLEALHDGQNISICVIVSQTYQECL